MDDKEYMNRDPYGDMQSYGNEHYGQGAPYPGQPYQQMPDMGGAQQFNPQGGYQQPTGYPPYGAPYGYQGYPPRQIPPPKKHKTLLIVLLSITGVLFLGGIAAVAFFISVAPDIFDENSDRPESHHEYSFSDGSRLEDAPEASADPNGPQISFTENSGNISDETKIANEVYSKAAPSVVCITAYSNGGDYTLDAESEGSGIILTQDGYIATNSHVVDDSKSTGVMVTLFDESQYLGTVIGVDKKTDLAVIKINAKELQPAEFADSSTLLVGQEVFAIGNPGGSAFSNSLTKGAVSALNRILVGSGYVRYIQTDAAINPGNSGGALVNDAGQVVGINTAKLAAVEYEGMGFAIPSNTVLEIINKLIRYGYVNDRGTLSIEGKTCDLYMSKLYNVPMGMKITKILSDSPLAKTKAKEDDIITAVDGVTISSAEEFVDELRKSGPGDTIRLTLYRPELLSDDGETFDVSVTLISDE